MNRCAIGARERERMRRPKAKRCRDKEVGLLIVESKCPEKKEKKVSCFSARGIARSNEAKATTTRYLGLIMVSDNVPTPLSGADLHGCAVADIVYEKGNLNPRHKPRNHSPGIL